MDSKKIAFIMCVNNERSYSEALHYINNLIIPNGYEAECIAVTEAASMASGYNEAMRSSKAKYKVYLHQDVMIVEPNFVNRLLEIFNEPDIGMIGMVGTEKMPPDAVMWNSKRIGGIYSCGCYCSEVANFGAIQEKVNDVEAVDGLLIATQYDIPWRDDIFDGWDFYDASQSYEFRRKGYRVVVPNMEKPWCIHDDDLLNLRKYYDYRERFIKEYIQKNADIV